MKIITAISFKIILRIKMSKSELSVKTKIYSLLNYFLTQRLKARLQNGKGGVGSPWGKLYYSQIRHNYLMLCIETIIT